MSLLNILGLIVMGTEEEALASGLTNDTRNLPSGIYVIRIENGDQQMTQKLVITH